MRSLFIKYLLTAPIVIASIISNQAIAATKIIFKDINNMSFALATNSAHEGINNLLNEIQEKHSSLYEIVIYKMPDHYIFYLLSGEVWGATKMRVDLDASGQVSRIIDHYQKVDHESQGAREDVSSCPDKSVQFVVMSAYPNIGDVNRSIEIVSSAAMKKYKTVTILDENADGQTYKNWLSCPRLKGFYSIGHGMQEGIIVGNGDIVDYGFFMSKKFNNKFKDATIILNSCLVYNYPFGTQLMFGNMMYASDHVENPGPNAYEYLGGHTSLLMHSSELTSACFVEKAIDGAKMDYNTLKECVGDKNIHYQSFGLSHPGRYL